MRSQRVFAYSICCLGILRAIAFCAFVSGSVFSALSQAASCATSGRILYDEATHTFRMDGAGVSYVFGVNQNGELQTLYWGKRLQPADPIPPARADGGTSAFDLSVNATPQEFTGWGGGLVVVPDLKVSFPDGNRDLVLRYASHSIQNNTLIVTLKDISRDVVVELNYRMDEATGVLARSARIENRTRLPFTIEQAFAGTWNLDPSKGYQLRYLTGRWAGEWNLQQVPLLPGKIVLESRRGSTGDEVTHGLRSNAPVNPRVSPIRTSGMFGLALSVGAAPGRSTSKQTGKTGSASRVDILPLIFPMFLGLVNPWKLPCFMADIPMWVSAGHPGSCTGSSSIP